MPYLSISSRLICGELAPTRLHKIFCNLGTTVRYTSGIATKSTTNASCDAIMHARSQIGTPEKMKFDARNSLLHAVQVEQFHINQVNEDVWIGNSGGLDIIKNSRLLNAELASIHKHLNTEKASNRALIASLKQKITAQEKRMISRDKKLASEKALQDDQIASLRSKITVQDQTIATQDRTIATQDRTIATQGQTIATQWTVLELADSSLEKRLRSVIIGNALYKGLRGRFLSTFKRDHLKQETEADDKIIKAGNHSVHGGDAVEDATLYSGPHARIDTHVFIILYGLSPEAVNSIRHEKTISVLNKHADVMASDFEKGTKKFYKLFSNFVDAFEKSKYDESYLDGGETEVTLAYWAFITCIPSEVEISRPQTKRQQPPLN